MDQWVKRTQRDYTLAFKLGLVELIEKGELTPLEAKLRYGIQGASTVQAWLRRHGKQQWGRASSESGRPQCMDDPSKLTPEQRIRELQAQLKEAREKAAFFEAVVTVLKKDYGVTVAKKPAGKSSRKASSRG